MTTNPLKNVKVVYKFFWKLVRQRHTNVTSFCMQFEKGDVGYCGRLSGVRGSVSLAKREREKKKVSFLENRGEHWIILVIKTNAQDLTAYFLFSPLIFGIIA